MNASTHLAKIWKHFLDFVKFHCLESLFGNDHKKQLDNLGALFVKPGFMLGNTVHCRINVAFHRDQRISYSV